MPSTRSTPLRSPKLIRIRDVTIAYHVDGNGVPIVLLPSLGRGAGDFDPLVPHLVRAGFRVLRPEPRGFGASAGPTEHLSLQGLARDIADVIEAEAGGPAIVLGHAFGNWVARTTAVEYPALVRGVVLAAAAAREQSPEVRAALGICHDETQPRAARLAALQFAFFAPGHDPSIYLEGWSHAAIAIQRQATAASPRAAWWHAGTAPILDLQAALDPFRPPSTRSENVDEFGSRVTVTVIADASHALIPEQPVAVATAIADWSRTLA